MATSTINATQSNNNGHDAAKVQLLDIPLSKIVVTEDFNPRGEVVEDAELQAMAATMRERGCLQPIRVRATDTGDFALIAGERRYRAAALAELTALPAVVLTAGAGDEGEYQDLLTDAMIENELRSEILDINQADAVLVEFDVTGRQALIAGDDLAKLRLGYAQHIHRAQGATVTRTLVVTGGWQTSKEPAYVEASRARQGTDWYVSRQDLGTEGRDSDRIQRLAHSMRRSHVQTPSLAHPELPDRDYGPGSTLHRQIAPSRTSRIPGIVRQAISRIVNPPAPQRTR